MAAPTFVSATVTAINTTTTPLALAGIAVNNGDVIVCCTYAENGASGGTITPSTTSGSTSGWTQRVEFRTLAAAGANSAYTSTWTATATATGNITVSCTKSASAPIWGHQVKVWRGSSGIGNVAGAGVAGGATGTVSVGVTTTGANSGLDFANTDWNATQGTVTFTASNGSLVTDLSDQTNNLNYCVYASHVVDAGAAGAKTMGMSAPTNQGYTCSVVEIKGSAPFLARSNRILQAVKRASLR